MTDTNNDTNDDDAALWASRLDNGPLDAEADRALTTWLTHDPRRAGSLLRAEACLAQVRRLRAVLPIAPPPVARHMMPSRRRIGAWMLAAGGAIAATVVGVISWPVGLRYATTTGEVRRVPLDDGTIVSINTASSLRVDIDASRRRVMLDSGEAWFQVAHDRARPFLVEAGPVQVRAIGTAFSMRRRERGVDLLVTEGVVEARTDSEGSAIRVTAGQKTFLSPGIGPGRATTMPDAVERELAWRHGEMALDGQTLGQAVAEINRYNSVRITVDPAIADEPLVGYFRTNDPQGFAASAAALNHARVVRDGNVLHIKRK